MFLCGKGKVESLASIINRALVPVQLRAGVTAETGKLDDEGKPIHTARYTEMHALRHFYASWCTNRPQDGGLGLPPKVVRERLGHATIKLTINTYAHLYPRGDDYDELDAAASKLLS